MKNIDILKNQFEHASYKHKSVFEIEFNKTNSEFIKANRYGSGSYLFEMERLLTDLITNYSDTFYDIVKRIMSAEDAILNSKLASQLFKGLLEKDIYSYFLLATKAEKIENTPSRKIHAAEMKERLNILINQKLKLLEDEIVLFDKNRRTEITKQSPLRKFFGAPRSFIITAIFSIIIATPIQSWVKDNSSYIISSVIKIIKNNKPYPGYLKLAISIY